MNERIRSDFPVTREMTYLDTAYDSPYPLPVLRQAQAFLEARTNGTAGRTSDWADVMDQSRRLIAELINAKPAEISITTNTTEGTNVVATSLRLEPGDNVVWDDLDYPSNIVVWLNQERARGVENRVVENKGGMLHLADFERVVDTKTKVISISHVSDRNGYVHDLRALADLAHAHGAYIHVDGSQAVGAIQVDVKSAGIDFLTCGAYKWLLGPIGLAFFYVREELLPVLEPVFGGWRQVKEWQPYPPYPLRLYPREFYSSARKFEYATVHFQGVFELKAALDYIRGIGMDKIEEQVLRLSSRLWKGLKYLGSELTTPPETRSGIVTSVVNDGQKTFQLLRENKIVASVKPVDDPREYVARDKKLAGSAPPGSYLRISPHFFNTEEEIDHLLSVLESRIELLRPPSGGGPILA